MLTFLKNQKESLITNSIKHIVKGYLERKNLGEMIDFKVDLNKKEIQLTMILRKESQPFKVIVKDFNFIKDKKRNKGYFTFESIKNSRDWNSDTLEKIIGSEERKIEIPNKYLQLIEMFFLNIKKSN
jgi:GTP-binding protein EngB required for normal cell division